MTPEVVGKLESDLRAAGKQVEFHIYKGAEHAFFNDTRPAYNKADAKETWERVLTFYRQHL